MNKRHKGRDYTPIMGILPTKTTSNLVENNGDAKEERKKKKNERENRGKGTCLYLGYGLRMDTFCWQISF